MEAFAPGSPGLPAGPASLAPGLPACCQRGLPAWPLVCQPAGRACQPAPWACQLGLQACQLRLLGCPQGLPACVMGRLATSWACQPACHLGLPLCHMALRAGHWACQPPGLPPGSLNWAAPGPPTWTLSSEPACHPSLSQEVKYVVVGRPMVGKRIPHMPQKPTPSASTPEVPIVSGGTQDTSANARDKPSEERL